MGTRYTMLREAVANLAASAEAQVSYLDSSFSGLTGGKSAEAYGNFELAMEFDDSFVAVGHMLEFGEISQDEIDALQTLDELLSCWSGPSHEDFWVREALFDDPRWQAIRSRAAEVLALLPDEARESDYTRSLNVGKPATNGPFRYRYVPTMRALLIVIAAMAFAFDVMTVSTLIDPPVIFAIEMACVVGWAMVIWRVRSLAAVPWIGLATGPFVLYGPLRWLLFNWCLLVGQCVA
ncbi:hypothetical protein [Sphingomonas sp. OTU376]|uniref:hypothetical protein n=1 Tax=Sphingomonas sp. OTU376 TaxID=3043863 RepID=UPI00313CDB2B